MASRVHAIHPGYGVGPATPRHRREVWYRSSEDPIVLPRGRSSSGGSLAVLVSAAIASSVILGGAYAVLSGPAPAMAFTPSEPVNTNWQMDPQPAQATLARAMQGPALAVPNTDLPGTTLEEQAAGSRQPSSEPEVIIDDRYQLRPDVASPKRPDVMPAPAETPAKPESPSVPYPNPTTTPPDAIGPELNLDKPTPGLDPENPYRD